MSESSSPTIFVAHTTDATVAIDTSPTTDANSGGTSTGGPARCCSRIGHRVMKLIRNARATG
jgi:hypothetical protein